MRTARARRDGTVLNGTDAPAVARYAGGEVTMLQTLAVILLILWLLGNVSSYTMGGFIHVLLVVAIVMFLFRFIQGRRLA
jgi:Family of unknown function (DUF5670)